MQDNCITVRNFRAEDAESLNKFIDQHKESMFYHSLPYLNFIQKLTAADSQHLIAVDDENNITGFLPLLSKSASLGKVINSSPFYGSHGSILASSLQTEKLMSEYYSGIVNNSGIAASVLVENLIAERQLSVVHNHTDYRIGQYTPIAFSENHAENLMNSFHYKTRNMVRKAMKSDLVVSVENDQMSFLMITHHENMKAIGGKPKSQNFFDEIGNFFKADTDYKIWVARCNGEPVAALLLFYYRDMVEYYTPVIVEAFRDKQPLSFLIYEAMKDASEKSYTMWNWGGTWATQGGVYTFKKRWGTIDKNYNYYIQLNNKEILSTKREILLTEYSDFFVVPFSLLTS